MSRGTISVIIKVTLFLKICIILPHLQTSFRITWLLGNITFKVEEVEMLLLLLWANWQEKKGHADT